MIELTKRSQEKQGPTLGVRLAGSQSKCSFYRGICLIERVTKYREPLLVLVLARYLSERESARRSNEIQGATLSVRFSEASVEREVTVYR